jgi:hypothetical protein
VNADERSAARDVVAASVLETLVNRYPNRFDAAQTEQLRRAVRHLVEVAATLRAYPLTNADEPDPIFRAFRSED